jgi:hypothetical protein
MRRMLDLLRYVFGGWRRRAEPSKESKLLAGVLQPVRRRR